MMKISTALVGDYVIPSGEFRNSKNFYIFEANAIAWLSQFHHLLKDMKTVSFVSSSTERVAVKNQKYMSEGIHGLVINLDEDSEKLGIVKRLGKNKTEVLSGFPSFLKMGKTDSTDSLEAQRANVDCYQIDLDINSFDFDNLDKGDSSFHKTMVDHSFGVRDVLNFYTNFKSTNEDLGDGIVEVGGIYHYGVFVKKDGKYISAYNQEEIIEVAPDMAADIFQLNRHLLETLEHYNGLDFTNTSSVIFASEDVLKLEMSNHKEMNSTTKSYFWENIDMVIGAKKDIPMYLVLSERAFLEVDFPVDKRVSALMHVAGFLSKGGAVKMGGTLNSGFGPLNSFKYFSDYCYERKKQSNIPENSILWEVVLQEEPNRDGYFVEKSKKLENVWEFHLDLIAMRAKYIVDHGANFMVEDVSASSKNIEQSYELYKNSVIDVLKEVIKGVDLNFHLEQSGNEKVIYIKSDGIGLEHIKEGFNILVETFFEKTTHSGTDVKFSAMTRECSGIMISNNIMNDFKDMFFARWQNFMLDNQLKSSEENKSDMSQNILGSSFKL